MVESADGAIVLAMLGRAGLRPSAAEIEQLTASYQAFRRMMPALDDLPGISYEEPPVIFSPTVEIS